MTAPAIPAGAADLADRLAVWRTVINGKLPGLVAVKPADQSRNTTTTFADDADLVIPMLANTMYRYELLIAYTAGATPQLKSQFAVPAGATLRAGWFQVGAAVGGVASPHTVSGLTGTDVYHRQGGLVLVGATAGNLRWQWAQVVSNGTNITAHRGSMLELAQLS